ncbi:MAG TPA: DUF3644 domain-containing protein [Paludibacter sp.]|jgi:hypothetical protein|nr:DUF3644 domain-containing protein [Paludibacter sp.]
MAKKLGILVQQCLDKSIQSALCAIEIYNKPLVRFRSGGYVTLMIISWTSLLHAIFLKRKIKPYYKEKNGWNYVKIDNEYKWWELKKCLKEFYGSETNNPVRKNLEFFIPLRNKIEHRFLPELDSTIFGECQQLLFNYDALLTEGFGETYSLRESLSFSLQLYSNAQAHMDAVKKNAELKNVLDFINDYRSSVSNDVVNSGKYAFNAILFQVVNNSNDAIPVKFFKWDDMSCTEKSKVQEYAAVFVKDRTVYTHLTLHQPDILTMSLKRTPIDSDLAKEYLKQICHESTKFLPIYYFIGQSKLSMEEVTSYILNENCPIKQKDELIYRIRADADSSFRLGSTTTGSKASVELVDVINCIINSKHYNKSYMKIRFFYAITHLSHNQITPFVVNSLIAEVKNFYKLKQNERDSLRKAICYIDHVLHTNAIN